MMKRLMIVAFVLLFAGQAFAAKQSPAQKAAEKLMNLFNMDKLYEQSMEQAMQMQLKLLEGQDLPEGKKEAAREAFESAMKIAMKKFSWDRMKIIFVDIYAGVFTAEELEGLIRFYETPIGRKFIEKQPELTTAITQKMQVLMQEFAPEMQKEMEKVLKKAGE